LGNVCEHVRASGTVSAGFAFSQYLTLSESTVITDCDRQAAEKLRVILADLTGFWHQPGDDGPLCQALSRHREECERRLLDNLLPWMGDDSGKSQVPAVLDDRPAHRQAVPPSFTEIKQHVAPTIETGARSSTA
jgi:hypothetical protein